MSNSRQEHMDLFYGLLNELAVHLGGPRQLRNCTAASGWPPGGVYFFFEDGELRTTGHPRVVRVGTHGLIAGSKTTLWQRLAQHKGQVGGQNPGGGNRRGSIFRRHVGAALIRRASGADGLLAAWLAAAKDPAWASSELQMEREVSLYIGQMPFLWLAVERASDRATIERNSIALLSCRSGGVDPGGAAWLGGYAPSDKVSGSGLWNVNHVDDHYDPSFLDLLASLVRRME